MNYLEKLKNKKQVPHELPKLPKGENEYILFTAKTAKRTFDSKDSTRDRHISEIKTGYTTSTTHRIGVRI
nr:hypothetical protein [Desulfobacula sp.]